MFGPTYFYQVPDASRASYTKRWIGNYNRRIYRISLFKHLQGSKMRLINAQALGFNAGYEFGRCLAIF